MSLTSSLSPLIPTLGFLAASSAALYVVGTRRSLRALPPRAKKEDTIVLVGAINGQNRGPNSMSPPIALVDPYNWLRDDSRSKEEVISHIKAENDYTTFKCAGVHSRGTQSLFEEFVSRMKETDDSYPYPWTPTVNTPSSSSPSAASVPPPATLLYNSRTVKGLSYPLYCRRRQAEASDVRKVSAVSTNAVVYVDDVEDDDDTSLLLSSSSSSNTSSTTPTPPLDELVYLDVNELAKGLDFCDVGSVEPSADHELIAFSIDTTGKETYEIRFKTASGPTPQAKTFTSSSSSAATASFLGSSDVLENTNGEIEWGSDRLSVFYLTLDDAHRPNKVWRHVMGTPQSRDECLLTEDDERFWLGIHSTRSGDFLIIESGSKITTEIHLVPLTHRGEQLLGGNAKIGTPSIVSEREENVLYEVFHYRASTLNTDNIVDIENDLLLILSNRGGAINRNFSLLACRCSEGNRSSAQWRVLLHGSKEIFLTSVSVFSSFIALSGRKGGSTQIWLSDMANITKAFLSTQPLSIYQQHLNNMQPEFASPLFPLVALPTVDEVYTLSAGVNKDYYATAYRFGYGSPTTPQQVCEVSSISKFLSSSEFITQSKSPFLQIGSLSTIKVLKQKEAPNCDPTLYKTRRVWATASDGTKVPISIVYKPSAYTLDTSISPSSSSPDISSVCPLQSPAPMLLYSYGSYGHSIDLRFSAHALSLMDRGVLYAVAHVRGGSEMGRFWYEDEGKLFKKKNTFSDYIACAEHLIETGWTIPGAIAVHGASAGGLLCGAVLNARPDLWGAVCSDVGFVDCVLSVADPSVPLSVTEWEEWGNPNERASFDYISSYSPIENVSPPPPRPARSVRTLFAARRFIRPQVLGPGYAHPYPPILLTAGLHDSRVAYWEAAKFAARLRDSADTSFLKQKKTGNAAALSSRLLSGRGGSAFEPSFTPGGNILLKTDMGAGHFSYSDRYVYEREKAFAYSFILTSLGVRI